MSGSLSALPTGVLLRALKARADGDPLRYFRAASPEQEQALRCTTPGCLVIGGNRSGKTVAGAVETAARACGTHPYGKQTRPVRLAWCVSQDLPSHRDRPHVALETLRRFIPVGALRGQSWARAWAPGAMTLSLASGAVIQFKSYEQGLLAFESSAVDWIWFDEEPYDRAVFTSCLLRLLDRSGGWMMTLTPVLSLEGRGWVESLWDRRAQAEADGEFTAYTLPTRSNIHLPAAEVEALAGRLAEEERAVRMHGAFARLGGRVLSEFSAAHDTADFLPSPHWRHFLVLDFGWRTSAGLWCALDTQGVAWLYAELYEHQLRPDQVVARLHAQWLSHGSPPVKVFGDPAGFAMKRSTTGVELPSDADEYRRAAHTVGADWLRIVPADNSDTQAWRVKRLLQQQRLRVCAGLRWWRWEQERWVRQVARGGPAAAERAEPEAPVDRNNHLMDCTRYLANLLPDPDVEPAVDEETRRHWDRLQRRAPQVGRH